MATIKELQAEVCFYQKKLHESKLAPLNWGNCSIFNRELGVIVIKPSGVYPDFMQPEDMVVVDISGAVLEGALKPSSDLATHLEIYRAFSEVSAVVHTHSKYATLFAQAKKSIPCFGTTHADVFKGDVGVTRSLREDEVNSNYEKNTGSVIIEHYKNDGIDPLDNPGILVACHGPFVWGENLQKTFNTAFTLEYIAEMALHAIQLNENIVSIPNYLSNKHYTRKHGTDSYYGQLAKKM